MSVARLGRRLVRRRDVLQALVIVAVPMAVLLALFMTIHALTLSPAQYSDQLFGRYAGSVELGGTTKTLNGTPPQTLIGDVRRDARDGQSTVVLHSYDLRFGELPRWKVANYIEADWAKQPFGREFSLLAGRLPRRVGEIAVADGLFQSPLGRVVTAASGNIKLRIVGVIQDRFAHSSTDVLAAAGTWDSFNWPKLRRAGFSPNPDTEVLGDFRDWSKMAALSARFQQAQGSGGADVVTANNRFTVASDPPQSFVEREPLVYRGPATAIAVLCPLLLLGLRGRRARRWTAILRAMGVRPGRSAIAVIGGSIILALAALPVGAIAGELLGLLIRPLLAPLSNQPLSPPTSPLGEAARFAALTLVALLAASSVTAAIQRDQGIRQLLQRRPSARIARGGRLLGGGFAIAGIVFVVPGVRPGNNSISISILAAVIVCLVVPDLLTGVRRASVGRGVLWRLISSRLIIDRPKSVAVCAALIVCVGPLVALSAENAADQSAQRATWDYQIPLGEVAVAKAPNSAVDQVDQRAVTVTERVTHDWPIEVTQLIAGRNTYADPPIAVVAPDGRAPQLQPSLLAVPSISALRDLLGDKLTARAATVLADGGVVHFGPAPSRAPIAMSRDQTPGTPLAETTRAIPVASIPGDHAWDQQGSGFMLSSTARRLHLPGHVHLSVFTHLNGTETQAISNALRRAGIPVQVLIQPRPFEPDPAPIGLTYGAYGMLLVLAVLMTIALGSSARSLRMESRSLVAIGVRRSWAQRALALHGAILATIGLLGGIIVGAVSIAIYTARLPGEPVIVPFRELAILTAGSSVIAVLTAWLASRRLTPRRSSS